jgi:hypothetical protein
MGNDVWFWGILLRIVALTEISFLRILNIACEHGTEPEQNIHGVLAAKETVSKLLLDAIYRVVVCEAVDPVVGLIYPGQGPGRTVDFAELALCVASNMAQSPPGTEPLPIVVGSGAKATVVTVIRATSLGGWVRVFRPTWNPAPVPGQLVRPLMPL